MVGLRKLRTYRDMVWEVVRMTMRASCGVANGVLHGEPIAWLGAEALMVSVK